MYIGTAKVDISPPVGSWLVGYLDRMGASTHNSTPLFARALAFAYAEETFILVSCELLAVHADLVHNVRKRLATRIKTGTVTLWISATHTHSGPPSYPGVSLSQIERAYVDSLPERLAEVAQESMKALAPASLKSTNFTAHISENRRRIIDGKAEMEPAPHRPIDRVVTVLQARDSHHRVVGTLVSATCHPVCIGRDNLDANGDYPGELSRHLEAECGGVALFLFGAGGDVNPNGGLRPDHHSARTIGRTLSSGVINALRDAPDHHTQVLQIAHRTGTFAIGSSRIDVTGSDTPKIAHLVPIAGKTWPEIEVAMDRLHPFAPSVSGNFRQNDHAVGEIAAARIGDVRLLALPFEPFSEIGLALKAAHGSNLIIAAQTNGALGYLAPASEYPLGGYEIEESCLFYRTRGPFDENTAHQVIEMANHLLWSLEH